jgi:hypothetical protein
MTRQAHILEVQLDPEGDVDAEELEELTLKLRRDLLELDVEAVDRPRAEEPPLGARAAEVAALGELLVTLAPTVLSGVIQTIRSWLFRGPGGRVKMQLGDDVIEVTGASSEQEEQLIAAFLARHAEA